MNEEPSLGRRLTVHVNAPLREFLESSSITARSHSERLARLAERYRAVMDQGEVLKKWTVPELAAIALAGRDLDLRSSKDAYVLPVRLRALEKSDACRGWGCDVASLSYRVNSLGLTDLLRLVDLCERFGNQEPTPALMQEWLDAQGVSA